MGIFKASGSKEKSRKSSTEVIEPSNSEKIMETPDTYGPGSRQSSSRVHSSRQSYAGSRCSSYGDDIKHEVMCNFLYQQQCSKLWITDGSGQMEGVMVKKARNEYVACPPTLAQSDFAACIAHLNVPVSNVSFKGVRLLLTYVIVRHDCQLQNHQHLPHLDSRRGGRSSERWIACANPTLAC